MLIKRYLLRARARARPFIPEVFLPLRPPSPSSPRIKARCIALGSPVRGIDVIPPPNGALESGSVSRADI